MIKQSVKQSLLALALAGTCFTASAANSYMQIKTNQGNIDIELYADKAPISVKNFEGYVKRNFYTGTVFHRVIPGFMIQGGGFDAKMNEKPTQAPIKNEANNGFKNLRGTLAMARTNDPNSATSQFFINVANNAFLDVAPGNPGYAVFGRVTKGMDVVDKIVKVPTGRFGMLQDVPKQNITITGVQIVNSETKAK